MRAILLPALIGIAATAQAATLDPLGDPDQFRRDVEEINRKPLPDGEPLARAVSVAVASDIQRRGLCKPKGISIGKLEPITLDGSIAAMIAKGQIENRWLTSVRLDGCPPADPIRIMVLRAPDGQSLQALFAGQGVSFAWPTLAREVLRATVGSVSARLAREDPACKPADLTPIGVRVTGASPDFGPSQYGIRLKGSWSELWTFTPCGHRVGVPIAFRTNGAGGAYWDIDSAGASFVK